MSDCRVIHQSVLLDETLERLSVLPDGRYIDGTLGSGGHAAGELRAAGSGARLLGIDRDQEALVRSEVRLKGWSDQCVLAHGDFRHMAEIARENGFSTVDGILMDVGVSSDQLETAGRGFSFMADGPLDMRMDASQGQTAAQLLAEIDEGSLSRVIRDFGEDHAARRIARAIVRAREEAPLETTAQLAATIERAVGRRGRLHPATRTFQALRIWVNDELGALQDGLEGALGLLGKGGRMAVISFHSLEDRIVKRFFASHVGREISLEAGGSEWRGERPRMSLVNRKPIQASENECSENPRARSAKLRVAMRVE
jgi:16S rRNA (cytosine1402-N4)-methyltransferase